MGAEGLKFGGEGFGHNATFVDGQDGAAIGADKAELTMRGDVEGDMGAVMPRLRGGDGGVYEGVGDPTEAGKLIGYGLLFEFKLLRVVNRLKLTATAAPDAKMLATRLNTPSGGLNDLYEFGYGETTFVLHDAHTDTITGDAVGDKDGATLMAANGAATVRHAGEIEFEGVGGEMVVHANLQSDNERKQVDFTSWLKRIPLRTVLRRMSGGVGWKKWSAPFSHSNIM